MVKQIIICNLQIQINMCFIVDKYHPCSQLMLDRHLSGAIGRVRLVLRHQLQRHLSWEIGKLGGASWF